MFNKSKLVKGGVASALGSALALASFIAPANAEALKTGEIIQPTAGTTQINLVGFNDYHGRITKTEGFASAVLAAEDAFGADNSLIIGNGDQVGASEFESSVAGDQPTKDMLVALGVESYTAGNHEFDKGQDDAVAIKGQFGNLLAANVTKADGSLLLDAYKVFDVNGKRVAVIGAVTSSTPSGVSPDGITGLTFSDPVAAVNQYADQLTDGDESNGEADVLVASYHEGGPSSGDLAENMSNEIFNEMVTTTSPKVAAIFNAHTHQTYNYDAPIGDSTRPVVQAANYGDKIGQIVLTVDEQNKVVASTSSIIDTYKAKAPQFSRDSLSPESQATYDKVVEIAKAAKAEAEVLGAEQIGVVNADITRAYTPEGGEDRGHESTIGTVVADSMLGWANDVVGTDAVKADLSIMNPGGLRADIAGDGVLTYKDAQTVLPFTNNLAVVTISGENLKKVFEEQWQVDASGNPITSGRTYLQLAMSQNVDYTYDASAEQGKRILSIYVNGELVDPAKDYKVVMPTFLAAGGDNFHSLKNASNVYDTGSVDLDAFVDYIKAQPGTELKPETHTNGFEVKGFAIPGYVPTFDQGQTVEFTVSNTDLHSKNAEKNTSVVAKVNGVEVGKADIAEGVASMTITFPADLADGDYTLELVAEATGSTVHMPFNIIKQPEAPAATITTEKDRYTGAESTKGVKYAGTNWAVDTPVSLKVTGPNGEEFQLEDVVANDEGYIEGSFTYATFDADTGEIIADNQKFPAGEWTITATQQLGSADTESADAGAEGARPAAFAAAADDVLTASTTFVIEADAPATDVPTPSETTPATDVPAPSESIPASSTPATGNEDGGLATTGADSNLMFGLLAAAAIAVAGGAALTIRRRNS